MSLALRPVAIYGLEVPCGVEAVDGNPEQFNASYRITMAAIDPTATPQTEDDSDSAPPPRATLKMIRLPADDSDDEADEDFEDDDVESIRRRLGITDEDEDAEFSDEETNGGPGEKTKKAREEAIKKALDKEDMDIDLPNGLKGTKLDKGKAKASDDEDSESDDLDDDAPDMEEFVICTLDSRQTYQQPLDILINAGEQIYFKVTGAFDVHLTGNFVIPENEVMDSDDEDSDDEEGMADYSLDELLAGNEGDSSGDELDDLEDPRIMEVDSEEEAPKLVKSKKEEKKNKKRAADDSDDEISKDAIKKLLKTEDPTENGEKLSKKQKKKLKNNAGEAAEAPKAESKLADKKAAKEVKGDKDAASANGSGKQVKFADKLEQGPTPTKADNNKGPKAWTVSGVKIDQRKAGSGPGAKKGDKVGMRYIGKLKDGKQFDANTKGEPFKFKLGHGEVIKGWDIGVQGMCVGAERRIVVPAQHAYGSKKLPGIPPNSELTFDLKLISIN